MSPEIAILIPALDEEAGIGAVMTEFHSALPSAALYVIDNNSADRTGALAGEMYQQLGCRGRLLHEQAPGKARAIRRAFADVQADIFVMVDADLTYAADDLPSLLAPLLAGKAEMVCGDRRHGGTYRHTNTRPLHVFGNALVNRVVHLLFRYPCHDILTGYRAMTAGFARSLPLTSTGFELEVELSLLAVQLGYSVSEIPISYRIRPDGSRSKLHTVKDGIRILAKVVALYRAAPRTPQGA